MPHRYADYSAARSFVLAGIRLLPDAYPAGIGCPFGKASRIVFLDRLWCDGNSAVDMYEIDDSVVVRIGIPGVEGEDINVSIAGDTLSVRITLGPQGRNVALDKKWGAPTIAHDGVTVAKEIELEEPFQDMGAQLLKEAATKANDAML
jgi:hypothetical protein